MIKAIALASVLGLTSVPLAFAQDAMMMCDEATFTKMNAQIDRMSDPAMQETKNMATREMSLAKNDMDRKDDAECMAHLQKAAEAINMKM